MASYAYKKSRLQRRCIRLLKLLPGEEEMVNCELLYTDLNSAPPFEALSYVWGDLTDTRIVVCDGMPFSATVNIYHALSRLRCHQPRLIWADAICINQQDTEERNQQVGMMQDIYSTAKRVVVWLGQGNKEEAEGAVMLINKIHQGCISGVPNLEELSLQPIFDTDSLSVVRSQDIGIDPNSEFFSSVAKIFLSTWFTRIWCVQEIKLAKEAIFFYGPCHVGWDAVGIAGSWLYQQLKNPLLYPDPSEAISLPLARNIWTTSMTFAKDVGSVPLIYVLSTYHSLQSSDPRDKVYAVLALAQKLQTGAVIPIDYSKSVWDVYVCTAFALIVSMSDLAVLSLVQHPEDYDGNSEFPSWVPQWKGDIHSNLSYDDPCPELTSCKLNSCNRKPEVTSEGFLSLEGVVLEAVSHTTSTMYLSEIALNGLTFEANSHPLMALWNDITPKEIGTLARTLVGGFGANEAPLSELDDDSLQRFYGSFLAFMYRIFEIADDQANMDALLPFDFNKADWVEYQSVVAPVCNRRRIFYTSKDLYGIGPACMRSNDLVVLLSQGVAAYVVRPLDDGKGFLYLGECYIDEIATGELDSDIKELTPRVFEFR